MGDRRVASSGRAEGEAETTDSHTVGVIRRSRLKNSEALIDDTVSSNTDIVMEEGLME